MFRLSVKTVRCVSLVIQSAETVTRSFSVRARDMSRRPGKKKDYILDEFNKMSDGEKVAILKSAVVLASVIGPVGDLPFGPVSIPTEEFV